MTFMTLRFIPAGKPARHIGENVRILNEERILNLDGPGYYIRDGIVIVPKNGVLQSGTEV